MTQQQRAEAFTALHKKGEPLVLYNIWDAGTAKAVADAGAPALATGSWSVAAAHGYPDGEAIPLELLATVAERIVATVDVPLSVDFEGAYAVDPADAGRNVSRILAAGAIGVNFEDRVVGGEGLHAAEAQAQRIAGLRSAGDAAGIPFFINARTDLFLGESDRSKHGDLVDEAIARAGLYAGAGASGFFVPGLVQPDLIARICQSTDLPVNVMALPGAPSVSELSALGVARISHGPGPYRQAMKTLMESAEAVYGS